MRMQALSCGERLHQSRDFRVDPKLVIKTLKQLQPWFELPCQLTEDLVLLVRPWELGVGARLTIVIAQVLVSGKEPYSVAAYRTAEISSEVTVLDALVSRQRLAAWKRKADRLTGQARRLAVVRCVVRETIATLFCDDVENGALDIAVLSGRPHTLDLDFLNDVNARFRA